MNMKLSFIIASILILFNACSDKLESNKTITSIFQEKEIQDLKKILNFFNDQICGSEISDRSKLHDCYTKYFKRLKEVSISEGDIRIGISYDEQKKLYENLNDETFDEIWYFIKSWHQGSTDTLKNMQYRPNGKYVRFLEEFGKKNEKINDYYESCIASGGIPPTRVADVIYNYEDYNIKDVRVRLVIAIHYLTMNDGYQRKEKYVKGYPMFKK